MEAFFAQFDFNSWLEYSFTIRREFHLVNGVGGRSPDIIDFLGSDQSGFWSNGFSTTCATQVTHFSTDRLRMLAALKRADREGERLGRAIARTLLPRPVLIEGKENAVYPYDVEAQEIAARMDEVQMEAAASIAGTVIAIQMSSLEQAIKIYNRMLDHMDHLLHLGAEADETNWGRIELYKKAHPNWRPVPYISYEHFFSIASRQGFHRKPYLCRNLIRITPSGKISIAVFPAVQDHERILFWMEEILRLAT